MQVHVKTPLIDVDIFGEGAMKVVELIQKITTEGEVIVDEIIDVEETDWYKETELTSGDWINTDRYNAGWTQKELGEKIGKSKQYISDLENNRRSVSLELAKKLAEVFERDFKRYL